MTLTLALRYILDYDGPFDGVCPTHVACKDHDTDYLRDPTAAAAFERGYSLLAAHGLSFDLQCCPAQMEAAAALFSRHADVPVVIGHMGKPRKLAADGGAEDLAKLASWRAGMTKLAALPHVSCKLSMLGAAVPGWFADAAKEAVLRDLVLEMIDLFGAGRCMFTSNWCVAVGLYYTSRCYCCCWAAAAAREGGGGALGGGGMSRCRC